MQEKGSITIEQTDVVNRFMLVAATKLEKAYSQDLHARLIQIIN